MFSFLTFSSQHLYWQVWHVDCIEYTDSLMSRMDAVIEFVSDPEFGVLSRNKQVAQSSMHAVSERLDTIIIINKNRGLCSLLMRVCMKQLMERVWNNFDNWRRIVVCLQGAAT